MLFPHCLIPPSVILITVSILSIKHRNIVLTVWSRFTNTGDSEEHKAKLSHEIIGGAAGMYIPSGSGYSLLLNFFFQPMRPQKPMRSTLREKASPILMQRQRRSCMCTNQLVSTWIRPDPWETFVKQGWFCRCFHWPWIWDPWSWLHWQRAC